MEFMKIMKKIKEFVRKSVHKSGFTLAEILVTLSIIGIVSALTIPALLASVDEKVYTTQKKSFTARLTTAISQLDRMSGYGKTAQDHAEAFVIELSKVYKLNSICDSSDVSACDVPAKIVSFDGETKIDLLSGKKGIPLSTLNTLFTVANGTEAGIEYYKDTEPAAFTTVNGESALVYYNPKCTGINGAQQAVQQVMCANIIYDLNGAKAPNQVGKDIGFATIFSNRDSIVAGVIPDMNDFVSGSTDTFNYSDAVTSCSKNLTKRIPDIEEMGSLFTNKFLLGAYSSTGSYWSGSAISIGATDSYAWAQNFENGRRMHASRSDMGHVRCATK